MGVFITLEILPEAIEPAAWASVYDETLAFLKGCPQGILGLQVRQVGKARRLAYSRDLEHAVDRPEQRHWIVSGDARSKTFGETFRLYRDIGRYRRSAPPEPAAAPVDILACGRDGRGLAPRQVFSDKTQGAGYHIPMLGTAMLVEAAFPWAALAGGDIDGGQARQAQTLVEEVLGRRIPLPVRVDGPRLLGRLRATRSDVQAMDAFRDEILGGRDDAGATLLAAFGVPAFARWFARSLKDAQCGATALGTIRRFTTWFNLGLPPDLLIEAACLDESGPRFDPVEVAAAIAATWVAVPPDESAPARAALGGDGGGTPETVEDQVAEAWLDLAGASGRRTRVHLSETTLVAAFGACFPDRCEAMRTALERRTAAARAELAEISAALPVLESPARPPRPIEDLVQVETLDALDDEERSGLAALGEGLRSLRPSLLKELQPVLEKGSWTALQAVASRLADARGIVLTEEAWSRLDDERHRSELETAVLLMSLSEDAKLFCDLRRAVLENPVLCRHLAGIMAGQA